MRRTIAAIAIAVLAIGLASKAEAAKLKTGDPAPAFSQPGNHGRQEGLAGRLQTGRARGVHHLQPLPGRGGL